MAAAPRFSLSHTHPTPLKQEVSPILAVVQESSQDLAVLMGF